MSEFETIPPIRILGILQLLCSYCVCSGALWTA